MIVNISNEFRKLLIDQVHDIYKDKPRAAYKFKKDLKQPFHFQKSQYFDNENIRDYVF